MLLRVVLASNAIQLEAARRLHDRLGPVSWGLTILLWEPERIQLNTGQCKWASDGNIYFFEWLHSGSFLLANGSAKRSTNNSKFHVI